MKQHTTPCKDCPFRKTVTRGALGGSPPEVYVGQIVAPFWLPCHSDPNYKDKQSKFTEVAQCAGAACFRTHIGVDVAMPSAILTLPVNVEVFEGLYDFYAWHKNLSLGQAHRILTREQIWIFAIAEFNKQEAKPVIQR